MRIIRLNKSPVDNSDIPPLDTTKVWFDPVEEVFKKYDEVNSTWTAVGGSSDSTVFKLSNTVNKQEILTYNVNGDIESVNITYENGDTEQSTYSYSVDGNIATETIIKDDKEIANTFTYDTEGNITNIDTVVTDIVI